MTAEFQAWPKIPRYENIKWTITEKIDGTNACVIVDDWGHVFTQSRSRILTLKDDNFGFANWVEGNKEDFQDLGPGYYYGEWWGKGIQRGYGKDHNIFSLFDFTIPCEGKCFTVVPHLGHNIEDAIELLRTEGSRAALGWSMPEGLILSCGSLDKDALRYKIIFKGGK